MSDLTKYLNKPDSKKILINEIDIGQDQDFWTNYRAGVWFVNFDKYYPNIDSSLLVGVSVQDITKVGSVKASGVSLKIVNTKADVQTNDSSFHYDSNFKSLYVHCPGGDDPDLFIITLCYWSIVEVYFEINNITDMTIDSYRIFFDVTCRESRDLIHLEILKLCRSYIH